MGVRFVLCVLALVAVGRAPARAQGANPDFDAVAWNPLGCDASPLTAADPSGEKNLVGDGTFPAAYVAQDGTYLYFRYRVTANPLSTSSARGFIGSSDWSMLLLVPSGNGFQYQYELSLNGDGASGADTLEVWANNPASDLTFDPLFTDEAETRIFSQVYNVPSDVNTTPLARGVPTNDGSDFKGNPDYFVDVAFPISALIASGVVASPAELADVLFFPATGSSPNRHNKDHLNCRFLPMTTLAVTAGVTPPAVPANTTTRVSYTITVRGSGPPPTRGIEVSQPALAVPLTFVSATVSGDPGVTFTVVSENPLDVRVDTLPVGRTLTVRIDADVHPGCSDPNVVTTVTAVATNAVTTSANAILDVQPSIGVEVCDGVDNNCDGQIDEGGDTLCDDGNACNGAETCGGQAGCQPGTEPSCDDGDPCTGDTCEPPGGCVHTPLPSCPGCTAASCADTDPCTTDTCDTDTGICRNISIPGCMSCTTATADVCIDADPCTDDTCNAQGICQHTTRPDCTRCATVGQCDDGNECTTEGCDGGVCTHAPVPDCPPSQPAPELCGDGVDNDGDGLVDCADPDCAAAPECAPPPREICDNCVDDDGDGLVDAEDPDCCPQPMALGVGHLMLQPSPSRGQRLRLDAQYAPETPPLFDPLKQTTSVQLRDGAGALMCVRVGAEHWRRARRLLFRFKDPSGRFAGGIQRGEFRINHDGKLLFMARARALAVRSIQGATVRMTVAVGGQCSQSSMALRPARKGLVFP